MTTMYGTRGLGRKLHAARESGITIFLYGDYNHENDSSQCNYIEVKDYEKTFYVEQLCHRAALFLKIGVVTIPLFAMYDLAKNVWLAPNSCILCSKNESCQLVFRIRFMPSPRAIVNIIFLDDIKAAQYLFLQCRHDFLNDHVMYGSKKTVSHEHLLGLVVMDLVRYGKEKKMDLKQIENLDIKNFIPSSSKDRYKTPWDRKRLQSNIKPYLHKQYEKEKDNLGSKLMKNFILGLKGYMESYGAETFEIGTGHKICVDPYRADNKPAIYTVINDKEVVDFCQIEELISLSTHHNADGKISIMLNRRENRPEKIDFCSEDIALSFIALLDGYHRMLEDYHHNLCPIKVRSLQLDDLRQIGCHGPVSKKWVEERLRMRNNTDVSFNYLLKQRSSTHDSLVLAYISHSKHISFFIIEKRDTDGGVKYGLGLAEQPQFPSIPELLKYYKSNKNNDIKLKKCVRPVDPLDKRLYLCREENLQNRIPINKAKQHKAEVSLVSGVHFEDSLGYGQFTEVYKGKWEKESSIQTVAIKRLRKEDSHGRFIKLEEFTKAIHKAAFWSHATITTIHALCLAPTFCVLLEYAELGPLDKFLQIHKNDVDIYSLIMVAEQLAQALLYLETRQQSSFNEEEGDCHGNIRTRNIVVFEHKDKLLRIKLCEPGMVYEYNKKDIRAPENAERLPWIAPELYNDLHRMTLYSDRYAYGMTLWEILSQGDRPFTYMDFADIMKFVTDRNNLEKPHRDCPDKMYDLMKACWSLEPQERIAAKEIVRDICNFLQADYRTQQVYEMPELKPKSSCHGNKISKASSQSDDTWNTDGSTTTILADEQHPMAHDGPYAASSMDAAAQAMSGGTTSFMPHQMMPLSESMLSCDSTTPLVLNQANSIDFGSVGSDLSQITVTTGVQDYEQSENPEEGHDDQGRSMLRRPLPKTPEMPEPVEPLHHENIKCDLTEKSALGEGHYGAVHKGFFITNHGNPRPVAIKMLKPNMYNEYRDEFEKEFQIMIKLKHHRIVEIIGHCPQKDPQRPMWLVMEYVENGSLIRYLQKNRGNLQCQKMLRFGAEIVEGMLYLSHKKILHRDLAARNVLVTKEEHMKITDFGLARVVQGDKNYYKLTSGKEFPMCWTAPEGLMHHKYTIQSDVWSFGITMWEIVSYGQAPKYDNVTDVPSLITVLIDGVRLPKPKHCPSDIYRDLIMECSDFEPCKRKTFRELQDVLVCLQEKYKQN